MRTRFFPYLNLERFFWQPCRQIESLEKDCFKLVCKNETVKGYAGVSAPASNDLFAGALNFNTPANFNVAKTPIPVVNFLKKNSFSRQSRFRP
jgi:hypothetical protein